MQPTMPHLNPLLTQLAQLTLLMLTLLSTCTTTTASPLNPLTNPSPLTLDGECYSCDAQRAANLTAALEPEPGADNAYFHVHDLANYEQCLGRVPHALDPSADMAAWVPCSSSDVLSVRFANPTTQAPVLQFRYLRMMPQRIRYPLMVNQTEYEAFEDYYFQWALAELDVTLGGASVLNYTAVQAYVPEAPDWRTVSPSNAVDDDVTTVFFNALMQPLQVDLGSVVSADG